MKNRNYFSILVFLSALLVMSSHGFAGPQPGGNFATVDIGKVFDEYEKTKTFDADFQVEGKKKQEERDVLVQDVRRLRDEQALLEKDARAKKQEEVDQKLKQLEDFDEGARRTLGQKRDGAVKEIFTDIENTVRQYGERKGYDFVLNERALLYRNQKYDVTADILGELNKNYKKK